MVLFQQLEVAQEVYYNNCFGFWINWLWPEFFGIHSEICLESMEGGLAHLSTGAKPNIGIPIALSFQQYPVYIELDFMIIKKKLLIFRF